MIGLLGCGIWGRNILRDLVELGAEVHVVETDATARGRAMAGGARLATEHVPPVGSVRGWVIATPATVHEESIAAVLSDGVPLLCEKPLANDAAAAQRIERQVRAAGIACHMVDVWRYHPAVTTLAAIARDGTIGEPLGLVSTRANWTSPRQDVDTLSNLGPHEISLYREILAAEPVPASAFAERLDGRIVSAWIRFEGAAWMQSLLSNRWEIRRRELRLHGSAGIAVYAADRGEHLIVASGPADDRLEAAERRRVELPTTSALRAQLADWLGFLDGGPEPKTSLRLGVQSVEIIETLRQQM
jgi:predicted dehydrogenase